MNELSKGANAPLGGTRLAITVVGTQPGTVDLMVLQLTADGVVRTDDDFVFYKPAPLTRGRGASRWW